MGGGCFEMQNVSRQSTVAEFREEFNRFTENMKQDASAVWMWSVTKLDDKKIDKSDQKRRAKKELFDDLTMCLSLCRDVAKVRKNIGEIREPMHRLESILRRWLQDRILAEQRTR
ncbi:unnamed protein product [Sphagnum jensenii]